ncbi:retropepsin-like aspartic protease family protein [Stakelama saccharophila]|uniref:TIGR02281 family clan AA aspartic protease n=1 Tax=Stakelama saccharophila TaxID=3075605 RepID=A0ABZ0B5H7_9SPHN|nr:TIGR02281 family clan AA aspartic protease [Stakelama sp. W311]WNO52533.1 TIGR02281 family clan AA aspartic protease [Stakelama sp. W311]
MSSAGTLNILFYILLLVLVLSALSTRRLSATMFLKSLIGWAAIAAILYVAVDHRRDIVRLAAGIGIGNQKIAGDTTRIRQSSDGHFWARVELNGVERRMLIDSGATITALSKSTADAAGIEAGSGFPVLLNTANGMVEAQRGTIDHVVLGNLRMDDLDAVIAPSFGDLDVIGMNFLSRLGSWRVEGDTLILEPEAPANSDST